ncbi:hypothetical protein ACGFX8_27510 [Streptomyces sp. NPDC048362]|uniref:hypothetical protein n=1 Tax=Streptomyces sp. NPDC048362 TaxID=3365539 RepID=UPI003716C19C
MPQHAQNTPVCRDCDGFPVVAIDTGTRHDDGTRLTLRVTCQACKGTGHTVPASGLARVGR